MIFLSKFDYMRKLASASVMEVIRVEGEFEWLDWLLPYFGYKNNTSNIINECAKGVYCNDFIYWALGIQRSRWNVPQKSNALDVSAHPVMCYCVTTSVTIFV